MKVRTGCHPCISPQWSSCLHLLNAGITVMNHYARQQSSLKYVSWPTLLGKLYTPCFLISSSSCNLPQMQKFYNKLAGVKEEHPSLPRALATVLESFWIGDRDFTALGWLSHTCAFCWVAWDMADIDGQLALWINTMRKDRFKVCSFTRSGETGGCWAVPPCWLLETSIRCSSLPLKRRAHEPSDWPIFSDKHTIGDEQKGHFAFQWQIS